MSAASSSGPLRRGTTAATPASTIVQTWKTVWAEARSGMPRAWYCPQSQIENGESRSNWNPTVRSQNVRSASRSDGSRRRMENASAVAPTNAATNRRLGVRRSPAGYVSQRGTTISDANFVHEASAVAAPRAAGDEASQKPHTRSVGAIASFVFESSAYVVKG